MITEPGRDFSDAVATMPADYPKGCSANLMDRALRPSSNVLDVLADAQIRSCPHLDSRHNDKHDPSIELSLGQTPALQPRLGAVMPIQHGAM